MITKLRSVMAVGKEFIGAYRESHPADEVIHLDLFKENIPQIDADVFAGWGKLQSGSEIDQLSDAEKAKVARLGQLVDQFVAADKYVFVSPMWNFSFPPVLKAYVDSIAVAGKTFKYTSEGPVGLLTEEKRSLHIQASGGVYSEGPAAGFESGYSYLKKISMFFGIPSFEPLFVEGVAANPAAAPQIKADAIVKAKEIAKTF